jgi:hypothetical protein
VKIRAIRGKNKRKKRTVKIREIRGKNKRRKRNSENP